ncbi:carbohydrate ABC transporter permease [Glycomyces algeriensis]|uniref:Sugar ABC transporter permease n=1 Tax=Glycomyces algeriensis TaxID=256037 RepID=A0A9W6LG88_9ACTN|nr:carbohydrate ABC transporter permease [Glycomyces algeriensis]MDA1366351.1 carbohydrate ABC transporter permease [Glycomyces algeriensis]MDR7348699.1 cellobiose transport system permease protein [Glycomyces algeriensis]GLI41401.1 sugar ABC transporter permease [Glycomyces algeriensis]
MSTATAPRSTVPAAPKANPPKPPRKKKQHGANESAGVFAPTMMTRIGLIGVSILSVFPLYWMVVIASRSTADAAGFPPALLPGGNLGEHIQAAFAHPEADLLLGLRNSFIITGTVTLSVVLISTLGGFAFAKLKFRGSKILMGTVLFSMMVPLQQLGIVPLYIIMVELEWLDTLQAVILPFLINGFGIFLMRQYVEQAVPDEIIEAARIDGASTLGIWWRIVMPALRPAMVVLGLLTFMLNWNEFLWPFMVLSEQNPTIQLAIQQASTAMFAADMSMVFTCTLISIIPIAVLFVVFGRQIVHGIMEGSGK